MTTWKHSIQVFASLVTLLALASYAWINRELLVGVTLFDLKTLSAITLFTVVGWFCISETSRPLIASCGYIISIRSLFVSTCSAIAGNYLPLRIGTIYRAMYIKHRCGLTLAEFGAVLVGQASISSTLSATLLIGALVTTGTWAHQGWISVVGVALCVVLPLAGLLILPRRCSRWLLHFPRMRHAVRLSQGLELIGRNPRRLAVASAWHLGGVACSTARLWILYHSFAIPISVWGCLFITAAGSLSMLLSITPGGLGIREGVISVLGVMYGVPLETGLMVATLERGIHMLGALLIGGPSLLWVTRELAKSSRVQT
ncbi:MAG: YbhN family protein [Gimesia chilikensis]|uniref:YbhN family protein n=1 Tax=Gimesia chilikensis TaxID=2605989 RepID=UPI0037AFA26B